MAEVADYRVGDRVEHETCGLGTVTRVAFAGDVQSWREIGVHVTFDKIGQSGEPWRGVYDDAWFRQYTLRKVPQPTGIPAAPSSESSDA